MRQRKPGEDRDFREDMDEMGDDEQGMDVALTEQYVQDPPPDHVIEEPREGPIGITEYEKRTEGAGDDDRWPRPNRPAESDAMHHTRRP